MRFKFKVDSQAMRIIIIICRVQENLMYQKEVKKFKFWLTI
jgi:hypothetical protein